MTFVVKICGLRTPEHAVAAAHAGADWLGLVFAPSRRQVAVDTAATIVRAVRSLTNHPVSVVGLFVHTPPASINEVAIRCSIDYIQLSGDESLADAQGIVQPVIKALRLDGSVNEQRWINAATTPERTALRFAPCPFVVDAHVPGAYGGTGHQADWGRAADLARMFPILLAGGLTPENVGHAIAQVHPQGVDVSSGVECAGIKDVERINAFVQAARLR